MEEKIVKRAGMVFAMISAVAWGSYGVFATLLLRSNVKEITLVGLAPLALFLFFGIRLLSKPSIFKTIPFKYVVAMFLLGFILFNGFNYSYARAYASGVPVGIVSIVTFCNVFVTMIESYFILKYKFTMTKFISILLALLGLSMVLGLFGRVQGQLELKGLIWTVLIPIFFGTLMTLDKYFILKGVEADAVFFFIALGALSLVLTTQITPPELLRDLMEAGAENPKVWLYVLGFCAIPHAFCYSFTQEAMKRVEPAIYSICYSLDPVTAFILGALIFAQSVALIQIAGVIIVISAVAYLNFKESKGGPAPLFMSLFLVFLLQL